MKKLYDLYGIYLPIFLLILPLTVTLRAVALFTDLSQYGHFDDDLVITVANAIVAVAAVFFLTYLFFGKRNIKLIPSFSSAANYVPSALVAVSTAMLGVHLFKLAVTTYPQTASVYARVISVATPLLAFAAVIYFVLSSVMIARRSVRRSDFGIITLLFICMYVAYLYFDTTLPINAPTKIVDELAYLAIAMFFLGETRLSLGRENWRRYISFAFIGALMTAYSAIPNLIYYFARREIVSISLYESLLTLAFLIFIICKIFLTPMLTKDEESRVVAKIIAAAAIRQEELDSALPETENEPEEEAMKEAEADENQITIAYEEPVAEDAAEAIDDGEEKEASPE